MYKKDWLLILFFVFSANAICSALALELAFFTGNVPLGKQLAITTSSSIGIAILLLFRYFLNDLIVKAIQGIYLQFLLFFLSIILVDYFIISTLKLLATNPNFSLYYIQGGGYVKLLALFVAIVVSYLLLKPLLKKK